MCELTTQFPFYFTKNPDQFRREETLRSPSKWITAKVLIFWSMSKRESLWQRNDVAILWFSWRRLLAHERVCWPRGKEDRNKSDRKSMFLFPSRRIHDVSRSGFNDWPFMSVHQWGESPQGVWELEIHNRGRYMGKLTFLSPVTLRPNPKWQFVNALKEVRQDVRDGGKFMFNVFLHEPLHKIVILCWQHLSHPDIVRDEINLMPLLFTPSCCSLGT